MVIENNTCHSSHYSNDMEYTIICCLFRTYFWLVLPSSTLISAGLPLSAGSISDDQSSRPRSEGDEPGELLYHLLRWLRSRAASTERAGVWSQRSGTEQHLREGV